MLTSVEEKKTRLDRLRPLSPGALKNLENAHDLEPTCSSNAIEGNTLTQIETNLVIEQGITIGGKKLKDHLEAIDHYEAIAYVRAIAGRDTAPTECDVRSLHALVMRRSDPRIAGSYAGSNRDVNTDSGRHAFPSPAEVPARGRVISPRGFPTLRRRRRPRSSRIAIWSISIRLMTATGAPRVS